MVRPGSVQKIDPSLRLSGEVYLGTHFVRRPSTFVYQCKVARYNQNVRDSNGDAERWTNCYGQ